MMRKISAMLLIPIMVISALLIKPELIGAGMFITSLILELMVIFTINDDHDEDKS